MKIGSYWDETQVAIIDMQTANYQSGNWGFSAPALAASVSRNNIVIGVVFVEAVPGSEHYGQYTNPVNLIKIPGNVVKVNVWEGKDIQNIKLARTDIWPLEWFGLTKLPPYTSKAVSAFDHAMGVVG